MKQAPRDVAAGRQNKARDASSWNCRHKCLSGPPMPCTDHLSTCSAHSQLCALTETRGFRHHARARQGRRLTPGAPRRCACSSRKAHRSSLFLRGSTMRLRASCSASHPGDWHLTDRTALCPDTVAFPAGRGQCRGRFAHAGRIAWRLWHGVSGTHVPWWRHNLPPRARPVVTDQDLMRLLLFSTIATEPCRGGRCK